MKKEEIKRVDPAAMEQALTHCQGTMAEIILRLAWEAGLTREEMQSLTWQQVDFGQGLLRLRERAVPMAPAVARCLGERWEARGGVSEFVVYSDHRRKRMLAESISRIARTALDHAPALKEVRMMDLRHDFIIRNLQTHDWPYVARVSGIAATTMYTLYSSYIPREKPEEPRPRAHRPDESKLLALLESEGDSAVALALRLSWRMGVQMQDYLNLTWEQVDLAAGQAFLGDQWVPLEQSVWQQLERMREALPANHHPRVLLTPRSRQPYDHSSLSKAGRTALIRGGLETMTLRDLVLEGRSRTADDKLLRLVRQQGSVSRGQVTKLLDVNDGTAYHILQRLTDQGKLIRIGMKYYASGTVVPPERQYAVVAAYLEQEGRSYRKELADLMGVNVRTGSAILKKMVREGKLVVDNQQYGLPGTQDQPD